ncbi:MAG: hypothetical protein EP330_22375 [Deltaproteobacteria bacterium]|nr:MAG: hypothetical protein EP330_22375 [Deltaproteobacteria bacterium]
MGGCPAKPDGYEYLYPSQAQCTACHSEAANNSLGPEMLQLNGPGYYPSTGRTANQMETLAHIGMFDLPLSAPVADLPRLPSVLDGPLTNEEASRAYVHANCSSCHRPNGGGGGFADYRYVPGGSIADWGVCGETAVLGEAIPLLSPGEPWNSAISKRMHALDGDRMPPLATSIIDYANAARMDLMIQELEASP